MTTDHTSTPTRPAAKRRSARLAAKRPPARPPVPGAGTLAVLALGWLLAVLSSARSVIGTVPEYSNLVVTHAALALPAVISASLLAGATVGLVAFNLLARRAPAERVRTGRSLGLGAGVGAATGLAAAAPIAVAYQGLPSVLVLCGTVATAALLGGLIAGIPARQIVAAGACGALGVFVVGFVERIFNGSLLSLFGARDTAESVLAANGWIVLLGALLAGVAAGGLGYAYLRRCGGPGLRWPVYLVAGAMPGLLVLLAEVITRVGGAYLFQLVSAASEDDQVVLNYLNASRFNRAMIVVFVGALVAIFLFGRTLRSPTEEPEAAPGTRAEAEAEPESESGPAAQAPTS